MRTHLRVIKLIYSIDARDNLLKVNISCTFEVKTFSHRLIQLFHEQHKKLALCNTKGEITSSDRLLGYCMQSILYGFICCLSSKIQIWPKLVPGVPPKKVTFLIDYRTKGICLIIKILFHLNQKHFNLDFETKFAQIQ